VEAVVAVLTGLGVMSVLIWLGIWLHPARPWDFQPVGDDVDLPPPPASWPTVRILAPARNEAESLPQTLPALLTQDYPGEFAVVVIDDRSHDGTADVAHDIAKQCGVEERLTVLTGAPLPPGWVGKVWALEQGAAWCGFGSVRSPLSKPGKPQTPNPKPQYLLLTDADILHAPHSLRRLVAESEQRRLALNSRMARLRCRSAAERLLIPPFVFFFNLLYPMRRVNDPRHAMAGAAGGCVLLRTEALARAGGFACIKDCIIDDVNLARHIKRADAAIQLALSRTEVESCRVYDSLRPIWVMVRRTAFTELRYSWLRLLGTVVGMALMFIVPPVWTIGGIGSLALSFAGGVRGRVSGLLLVTLLGLGAWMIMAVVYRPAVRFFRLPSNWSWTLPIAGVLYEGMTLDSAIRHVAGLRLGWRDQ
jgi:hopene-associated glycosyltransferase HpnB